MKYLALGDSYTIGEAVAENQRFPVQLSDSLSARGYIVNRPEIIAKTGWTTGELIKALREKDPGEGFGLVTLLIGVNNQYRGLSINAYGNEFGYLLDEAIRFADGNREKVIVISIPDWGVTPFAADRDREKIKREIDAFNALNRKIAEKNNVQYLDVTPISRRASSEKELVASDGLHPSGEMYSLWVDQLMPVATHIIESKSRYDE